MLAEAGLRSQAWDISDVALKTVDEEAEKQKLEVITRQQDVEQSPPSENSFDVIVVSYFLDRKLCADLVKSLRPGGVLFYQTFCLEKLSDKGPGKPEFLLERNELLSLFSGLATLYYREDNRCGNLQEGLRDTAQVIGQKVH
jgi:tellurite methyltransferase